MKRQYAILSVLSLILIFSCKKKDNPVGTNYGKVNIKISYRVDTKPLAFDTMIYVNQAGNSYAIERLQYYLSKFRFYKAGKLCYTTNDVVFFDARKDTTASFSINFTQGIESGKYDSITFYIGLDTPYNTSNSLPATLENIGMGWPDVMGGGYHFIKLEGHWNDNGVLSGFAAHIGQNGYQAHVSVPYSYTVPINGNTDLSLAMNINEWFRGPYTYHFKTDGSFTMGDTILMKKLATNGADVFYKY